MLTLLDVSRGALVLCPQQASGAAALPNTPPNTGGALLGISQIAGAADPGASNDVTTGITVGSVWFNSTAGQLRAWMCRDNTAGAAKWTFEGADYPNGGTNPNTEQTAFGLGTASIAAEGNINRQIIVPGQTTGANGSDIVLATFTLPANSFDVAGRGVTITAQGSFGGTTNNKRIKIIFNTTAIAVGGSVGAGNGTIIADTGTVATNGSGWSVQANVFKYGAAGSNTQLGIHQQSQAGPAVTPLVVSSLITATESGPIVILVTGNTTTAINDITMSFMEVNAMN